MGTVNKVINQSGIESAIYNTDPGDTVEMAFEPSVGFKLDLAGEDCRGVTLDLGGRELDGGLGWLIDEAYKKNLKAPIWDHLTDFVIRVTNPFGFRVQNGKIFNTGRCVHYTGDADNHELSATSGNLELFRFLERGLGGPCNNQDHDAIYMHDGVLMNFDGLMLLRRGKEEGWSLAAGPYKEWGTNKPTSKCRIRNSRFERCYGETLATFHNDYVVWENIWMFNASHTAFMYAEQGKRVIIKNVLCVADDNTPVRKDRGPYALMIASENNPRWPMEITVDGLVVYGSGFKAAVRGWQEFDVGIDLRIVNSSLATETVFDFDEFGDARIYVDNSILNGQMKLDAASHFEWGDNYDGPVTFANAGGLAWDDYRVVGPDGAAGYGYQFEGDLEPPVDVPPVENDHEARIAQLEAMVAGLAADRVADREQIVAMADKLERVGSAWIH